MNPIKYLAEVRSELAQVVWPKPGALIRLTAIVLLISLIIGAYLGGLDAGFTRLITLIITKK